MPVTAVIALVFAVYFYRLMMAANPGNARMVEIAGYVREGAMAYLFRQYKVVIWVFVALVAVFFILAKNRNPEPVCAGCLSDGRVFLRLVRVPRE